MARKKQNSQPNTVVGKLLFNQQEVDYLEYDVQETDTLFRVWTRFRGKTTAGAIKTVNGINGNDLTTGKTLKIPVVL